MGQFNHLDHIRLQEPSEALGTHEQRFLTSQVFRDVNQVNQAPALFQGPANDRFVNVEDSFQSRFRDGRINHQVRHGLLPAAKVAIEIEWFVTPSRNRVISPLLTTRSHLAEIPGGGVGPVELLDIGRALGPGEGI
jgi:hypothetical protein